MGRVPGLLVVDTNTFITGAHSLMTKVKGKEIVPKLI